MPQKFERSAPLTTLKNFKIGVKWKKSNRKRCKNSACKQLVEVKVTVIKENEFLDFVSNQHKIASLLE